MPADQTIDTVVLVLVIGLIALGLISMLVGRIVAYYDWLRAAWEEKLAQARAEMNEPEPGRSPHMNAPEPERTAGSGSAELALNADELVAVARMIKHNATAARPSKSSTIQAGFGVSRGGSAAYIRASEIYDALFGQPEPAIPTPIADRPTPAKFAPR